MDAKLLQIQTWKMFRNLYCPFVLLFCCPWVVFMLSFCCPRVVPGLSLCCSWVSAFCCNCAYVTYVAILLCCIVFVLFRSGQFGVMDTMGTNGEHPPTQTTRSLKDWPSAGLRRRVPLSFRFQVCCRSIILRLDEAVSRNFLENVYELCHCCALTVPVPGLDKGAGRCDDTVLLNSNWPVCLQMLCGLVAVDHCKCQTSGKHWEDLLPASVYNCNQDFH